MTTGAPYPRLVGDIGGTHARFGWVEDAGSGITQVDAFLCDDQTGLDAAVTRYLSAHGLAKPSSNFCNDLFFRLSSMVISAIRIGTP